MKILIATGIYPPSVGGPATYSQLLFDELPKRGIGVEVYSFDEVRHLPKVARHMRYFFGCLARLRQADLVFAQDPVSVGLPGWLAAAILGKLFIIRMPGDYAWEQAVGRFGVRDSIDEFQKKKYGWRVEALRTVEHFVVRRATLVIAPSKYFRDLVRGWVDRKKIEKVVAIYNGIDLADIPAVAEKFEPKTIISAGRLVPWKGFAGLIKTLALLPGWRLFIAGDGPERARLEALANASGVGERVEFMGNLPRGELVRKIQECEIFALNTSFESFSFQVVEAMAAGTPVVTTNIGNLAEIIDDGKEGILVAPGDSAAFGAAVKKLAEPEFRRKIVTAARKKAESFSIERTLNELVASLRPFAGNVPSIAAGDGPMNLISISTDRKIFEAGSAVAARMVEYGSLVGQLHVVVFTRQKDKLKPFRLAKNTWVYPTDSISRFLYVRDAKRLAAEIVWKNSFSAANTIVSAQDPFETGLVGVFLKKRSGLKLQAQIHTDFLSPNFTSHSVLNQLRVWMTRRVLLRADQVRVVSRRIKNSLIKKYPALSAEKISILPIFVDVAKFENPPAFNLREKYPQFSDVILMCSRLAPEKNIASALQIFEKVLVDFPTIGLIIVGDGPEKTNLKHLTDNLGISESVVFEPWTADPTSYYKTADIFLSTSEYEGYGLTLVEAGLAGVPVVTSDVGIAGELLMDGKNARVCTTVSTFIAALSDLLKSPTTRQALGQKAAADLRSQILFKEHYLREYKTLLEKTFHD